MDTYLVLQCQQDCAWIVVVLYQGFSPLCFTQVLAANFQSSIATTVQLDRFVFLLWLSSHLVAFREPLWRAHALRSLDYHTKRLSSNAAIPRQHLSTSANAAASANASADARASSTYVFTPYYSSRRPFHPPTAILFTRMLHDSQRRALLQPTRW